MKGIAMALLNSDFFFVLHVFGYNHDIQSMTFPTQSNRNALFFWKYYVECIVSNT